MRELSRERVQRDFNVSRETLDRLDIYVRLLEKWSARINLISRDTMSHVWHRHIADSLQLLQLAGEHWQLWLDLGSGAGFPGLVVAAATEANGGKKLRLVESDSRKCAFLHTVIRETAVSAEVVNSRIEDLIPQQSDIISARALAHLSALLAMTEKHRKSDGIGLFPKGRTVHKEIEEASCLWRFESSVFPSLTDPAAGIVKVGALDRV